MTQLRIAININDSPVINIDLTVLREWDDRKVYGKNEWKSKTELWRGNGNSLSITRIPWTKKEPGGLWSMGVAKSNTITHSKEN